MIVVGVDAHKRTHTLVAVDAGTGELRGQRMVSASDEGVIEALRFVQGLDEQRVWAIEDCRHVSGRLERALIAVGEQVIRVPPALMVDARRGVRTPGKSDPIGAAAVARAALREGLDRFPAAFLDEQAMEIRMLCDYRDQLISERVRMANRLRWHLLAIRKTRLGNISRQGSSILRWAVVEAAQHVPTRGGPLREMFERIAKRRGRKVARVAVARQILTLCYYGLRDGEIRYLKASRPGEPHESLGDPDTPEPASSLDRAPGAGTQPCARPGELVPMSGLPH